MTDSPESERKGEAQSSGKKRAGSDLGASLPTATQSGKRVWLYPQRLMGKNGQLRRAIALVLMIIYIFVPWLEWNNLPLLRLDFSEDRFIFFGMIFRMQDTQLLAYLIIFSLVSLFFFTSLRGRVWCSMGCPQTVFLDWLIRPIEEALEGPAHKRRAQDKLSKWSWNLRVRKALKHLIFLLIASGLAHGFLAFFVDPAEMLTWLIEDPGKHWFAFLTVTFVTGLLYVDFAYFREQFCAFVCPYAKFQAVMVDEYTPVIAYDVGRGDPRGKKGKGDCIDCGLCTRVCPTGIDIRQGLQLECIQCARCADACNLVMGNLGRELGLIRMASDREISGKSVNQAPTSFKPRPRPLIYGLLLVLLSGVVAFKLQDRKSVAVDFTRSKGAAYSRLDNGRIANMFQFRMVNNSQKVQGVQFEMQTPGFEILCTACGQKIQPLEKMDSVILVIRTKEESRPTERVNLKFEGTGQVFEMPFLAPGQ